MDEPDGEDNRIGYVTIEFFPHDIPTDRRPFLYTGSIRIYKTIPHDIAFLQSGSALRPVLSRSQCWNVDGRGIFCLQIRPGNFWRLEILELVCPWFWPPRQELEADSVWLGLRMVKL